MRHAKQLMTSQRSLNAMLVLAGCAAAFGAAALGCSAQVATGEPTTRTGGTSGSGNNTGSGGVGVGPGTGGAQGTGNAPGTAGSGNPAGSGGMGGGIATSSGGGGAGAGACSGPSDARLVVAPQRIVRLTRSEIVSSLRDLFGATQATAIANQFGTDNVSERTFPPLNSPREGVTIYSTNWTGLDQIAEEMGKYVMANFTTVTRCPATPTDACATTYLNGLAEKIYRRPLDAGELSRLTALYNGLKSSVVNGTTVTSTIPEATQSVVYALLGTPQFLYRSELGNKDAPRSMNPPGISLTAHELATQLSFFLTGGPPDQPLLDAAKNGTLTAEATLNAQVTRLLGLQTVKDNLTSAMSTYYKLNLLGNVGVDPAKFPQFNMPLRDAMVVESQKFLDFALWRGNMADLLTSTTTFLNSTLATAIYKVPVPAGATATAFVQTTLPADQRAGMLTNAGFLTSRARTDQGSVVARGLVIKEAMLCVQTPGPPDILGMAVEEAKANLVNQTAKEQVAVRLGMPICAGCHLNFDAYGLVLENYDGIGAWRTVDERNRPVEPSAKLPAALGGTEVPNAVEFGKVLASNPGWVKCMAKSVMQYALTDVNSAPVDLEGCAVSNVAARYNAASTKTFTELVRDVATARTILVRSVAQ